MKNDSLRRGKFIIAVLLVAGVLLFATACTQQQAYQDSAGSPIGDGKVQQINRPDSTAQVDTGLSANAAIVKLFARQSQVKSYSFDFATLPNGKVTGTYAIKGSYARVTPVRELLQPNYDVIFLDMTANTAAGYCLKGPGCKEPNTGVPVSYDPWKIPLPLSWAQDAQYGKIVGSISFYNKQVTRVQYQKGSVYYEVYIDNYFGYPVHVAMANDPDFKNLIGGYDYRNMVFNTLDDDYVVHKDV